MTPRAWSSFRISLAIIVGLLLTASSHPGGQTGTPLNPSPPSGGSSTSETGGLSRLACGPNAVTFIQRADHVNCEPASYNYAPLLQQVLARRNAALAALKCPTPACPGKSSRDVNLQMRCDKDGSRATVVLDSEFHCAPPPPTGSGITLPTGTMITKTVVVTTTFKAQETTDENYPPVYACVQPAVYHYQEKVNDCVAASGFYPRYRRNAKAAFERYYGTVVCLPAPPSCHRPKPPMITAEVWKCTDNVIEVDIDYRPCVP